MGKATAALWIVLTALLCAGCGSDEPPDSQPTGAPSLTAANGLTIDSEPTAELLATDETAAGNLAAEIDGGTDEAAQVARLAGAHSQVQTASAGERVVTMQSSLDSRAVAMATTRAFRYTCAQFLGAAATGTVLYTYPDTAPTVGWKSSLRFDDCSYAFGRRAYTVSGTMLYEYLRYVSGSDFGFLGSTKDLRLITSVDGQVVSSLLYVLSHAFDIHNNVITTSYATSTAVLKDLRVVPSGNQVVVNVVSVIESKEAGGVIRVRLSDWRYDLSTNRSVSGRALITGAKGTRVEILASITGYKVTYTDSAGKTTVYTLRYAS
jgi:hypothetical protein